MDELIQLKSSLAQIFREALLTSTSWENPKAVKELQVINQELDGVSPASSSATIATIIAEYRRSRSVAMFRDLKNVCYGAAMQMPDGWSVLGNEKLRDKLLADVEQLDEPRKRLKCFQALLSSYFAFALYDEQTSAAAKTGWETLRDWLARQRAQFQRDGVKNKLSLPGWFAVLTEHATLLTATPCDRYGKDLLRGDGSSIEDARQGLSIPGDSWVMEEAILSQVKAAVELRDNPFNTHLDQLLKIAQGQTAVAVSELLKRRAIAMLISRYARCASKPEHPALRDAAVAAIGNPWLQIKVWNAWVKNASEQPDVEAREMVNGWLKRRLITDFFDLMSVDGRADQRRLKYWLRFEPAIEDLWFILGPDAFEKSKYDSRYQEVEKRTDKKHWLTLTNESDPSNNAFIMRMGEKLVVEFGLKNNACFIYPVAPAPFSLDVEEITESRLKTHNRSGIGEKHSHGGSWEDKFDAAICSKVGYQPQNVIPQLGVQHVAKNDPMTLEGFWQSKSSQREVQHATNSDSHNLSYVEQYVKKFSLRTEDRRDSGGAFWVYTQKGDHPEVDRNLESWKFKYKQGRGWWRE